MSKNDSYKLGYLRALHDVEKRLGGSGAFNCGSHQGFEYPAQLVRDMIAKAPEPRMHAGRTWDEHVRLACEPEGQTTGLHRDSMG